ncbi:MAG TPA: SDR family NAD(P)-dependent oxidoreductase [Thermoflexia bacterium]|nr:SDR family NAD(P)-dependent oxidoreductase [Thermoflexia bacterium]
MKRGTVLVTGGAGFIGANLVRLFLEHGYRVTVLDNLSTGRREYLKGLPIRFVKGDILDLELVSQVVPGHAGVVHLAAQTGVPGSLQDPRRDCEVNVLGTLNLLEACRHADVGRFVFASSNAPLGRQPPPATEDKAPLPISPYGASKLAGEGYCLAYHGSWGLGTVVLRFANVYGPYSAHKSSVVAKFFKDILAQGRITIDGDGQQTRDFIYVDDLCRAILLALESDVAGEVFQIATGVETSIQRLAQMVQEVAGRPVALRHGPARRGDIRKNYSAVEKARKVLGWEPRVGLEEGLQETWRWFSQEGAMIRRWSERE